jgi:adenosylcobyric acid synthase
MKGGLLVCGTASDAGKSFVVAGLCRLLARRGVRVAPFKAQNMANNAVATVDGAEIGHAQWAQAVAAGVEPEAAMNPVLLKPTTDRACQVVVLGRARGVWSAADYQDRKQSLLPVVLEALAGLRGRFDVVICEGAGSPAEINLLDADITNLRLAHEARLPAIVVGDIDRGGVFAALYGTVALLPDDLRACVRAFVLNKFRGDPGLLGTATAELERRCGVPTIGVVPLMPGARIDAEDSLALDHWPAGNEADEPASFDVAAIRFPRVANFGDLDPLRLEPGVGVRWVRSPAELGRPHLVVLPGSKSTRADLEWLRERRLPDAIQACGAPVVGICAGLQMLGDEIEDAAGVEGEPGYVRGLGLLPVATRFEPGGKVLDRPSGWCVGGPGKGEAVAGYRIHQGRVRPYGGEAAEPWLATDDGTILGWRRGRFLGTTLHGVFESDGFRTEFLRGAAAEAGADEPPGLGSTSFAAARQARFDGVADALERHVDVDRLLALVAEGAPA